MNDRGSTEKAMALVRTGGAYVRLWLLMRTNQIMRVLSALSFNP